MEKIKSVLSGHKKSGEATHDAQTSPTGAHTESRSPIYDQMTTHKGDHVSSTAQPTSAGTTTSAGQTGTATGFGQTQHTGGHGAGYGENTRPGVSPNLHEGISEASIKSGVIGFGANERQGHAALPTHEPIQEELNRDQILGGGSFGSGQTTAGISIQHSGTSQAQPHSSATTHDRRDIDYENASAPRTTAQSSTSQQPFEKSLRQESYTADTDRSFPLAGGVTSKHHTEHSSMTHHPTISEREPGTKEREVSVRDGHGREDLAGAAAAAATGGVTAPLLHSEQRDVQPRGHDTQPAKYGDQPYATSNNAPLRDSTTTEMHHHPEALAAATAAAATSSTLSPLTQGQGIGSHDSTFANTSKTADTGVSSTQSYGTGALSGVRPSGNRSESWRHVPGEFPSPTPDDSKTFLFYRDSLVPAPGAETPLAPGHHAMHDQHPITTGSGSSHATSGPHSTDLLNKADPRIDSTRDGLRTTNTPSGQYGGAVDSGSSSTTAGPHQSNLLNKLDPRVHSDRDGSKTVGGASSGQPEPGHATNAPITSSTSTGVPSGQHELRHTGSLEQPRPRSSDLSEDHHCGRDAAIAGGVGAAGLGYAASHDRDTPTVGGDNSYPSSSPYSSKGIDPRVLGRKANLEEQRFDPQAKTGPSARHGVSSGDTVSDEPLETTTGPHKSALLNKLDPRVKDTAVKETTTGVSGAPSSAKQNEHEHHLGRDAALVGAGGVAAGGAHHALQRNDTPGTGTTVLPHQQSSTQQPSSISAPFSSAVYTSHPQSHATKPAYSDNSAYKGPLTTSGSPFYGTVGAPAPVFDDKASSSHQPASTSTHQQDPQHHYGRDAGLTGAGLTAAGGLAHANQRDHTADNRSASSTFDQSDPNRQTHHGVGSTSEDPASKTVGSHKSNVANILDPRVLPDPSKQKDHTTSAPHQSDTLNLMDPKIDQSAGRKDQHHFGRDAAIVGGAGTAAYGVHEAADAYDNHRMTQPEASMNEQRYNPTAPGARAANPVQSSQYNYNNDHTSRNAAFGTGAVLGAGALGGAAYAGSRHADNVQQVPASSNQPYSTAQTAPMTQSYPERGTIGQKTYDPTSSYPTQGTIAPQNTRSTVPGTIQDNYGSAQDPYHQDHSKRDAVVIGTTGAVAAHEKEQHRMGKDQLKHQKEEEKEFHRLEKEREKEAARLEKEREKEATTPEKKHGILSFLHRDKSKKEKRSSADSSPRQSTDARGSYDNPRHSKEYAALGASTTATAYDSNDPNSPRWKGKNRLHKDPPPGHPARDALEHQHEMSELQGGKREHVGVDGPIGNPNAISGYDQTDAGVYGAQPLNEIPSNNKVTDWDHGKRKDTPY